MATMMMMKRAAQYLIHRLLREVYSVTRVTPYRVTAVTAAAAAVAVRIRQSQIVRESSVAAALLGKIRQPFLNRTSAQSKPPQAYSCTTRDQNIHPEEEHAETPLPSRGEKNNTPPSQLPYTIEAGSGVLTLCETHHQPPNFLLGETSSIHNLNINDACLTEPLPPYYVEDTQTTTTTTTSTTTIGTDHIVASSSKKKQKKEKKNIPKDLLSVFPAESHLDDVTSSCGRRPLVIFFPWRGSNEKLRAKYCQVYQRLGIDVLCLTEGMTVQVCSQPRMILDVTKRVLDILQEQSEYSNRPLLLHCMSGGYMFAGSLLVNMFNQANRWSQTTPDPATPEPSASSPGDSGSSNTPDTPHPSSSLPGKPGKSGDSGNFEIPPPPIESNSLSSETVPNPPALFPVSETSQPGGDPQGVSTWYLTNPVVGMVLDCPVLTPELARRGIEFSIPNPMISSLLRMSMSMFSPLHDPIYEAYARAMITLDTSPKLLLHSTEDHLCPVSHVRSVVSELEARGVTVEVREFHEAGHVRLLGKDPEKYEREIAGFLKQLGVGVPDSSSSSSSSKA